jgi:hypothetical protein
MAAAAVAAADTTAEVRLGIINDKRPRIPGPFTFVRHNLAQIGSAAVQAGRRTLIIKRDLARHSVEHPMTNLWKAAVTAAVLAASASITSGCADAQPYGYDQGYAAPAYPGDGYDNGYDPGYGYDQGYGYGYLPDGGVEFSYDSGGYCDAFGCPDDYWDLPIYYGPVFFGGAWYDGPVYYRDWFGRRQYWIHGGWRDDEWRGARPRWWHEGRYGPALGLEFYRSHGFRGRPDSDRRLDNNRNFDTRRYSPPRVENRSFDNRSFDSRSLGNRNSFDRGVETRSFNNRPAENRNFDNRNVDRGRQEHRDVSGGERRDFGGGGGLVSRQPQFHAAPQAQAPRQSGDSHDGRGGGERGGSERGGSDRGGSDRDGGDHGGRHHDR